MLITAARLQSITVTPTSATIAAGLTRQFTATGNYSDGTSQVILSPTWSSTDTTVATVSATGLVKSLKAGNLGISASLNGVSGGSILTVTRAQLQTITVTPSLTSVPAGLPVQLTVTGNYSDGTSQAITPNIWMTEGSFTASVDSKGVFTSSETGSMGVSAAFGGVTGRTKIEVTAAVLQSVQVTSASVSVAAGLTQQFTAKGFYSNGSSQVISSPVWKSSDNTLATVSASGLVQSLKAGNITVSATFKGLSGSAPLNVTSAVLQTITVTPVSSSIAAGLTQQLTAKGRYSDGTSQVIAPSIWSSSDNTLATVGSAGLVQSLKVGDVVITASLNGVTGSATLKVTAALLQSLTVSPSPVSLPRDLTQQLTVKGNYSDGSTPTITPTIWSSSDNTSVSVSSKGLIQSLKSGTTVVISASFNGVIGTTTVNVPMLKSITVTGQIPGVILDAGAYFTATGNFSDGSSHVIIPVWSSSDNSRVTIDATGFAAGEKPGNVVITATLDGISGTAPFYILDGIKVTPRGKTLSVGQTLQLTATVFDANGVPTVINPTWSTNSSLISVSSSGLVTALAYNPDYYSSVDVVWHGLRGFAGVNVVP